MENNENFVAEQVTENVVQPTEPAVINVPAQKMFTQEDLNNAVSKAKARAREKAERDSRKKYEELEAVLRAGTGMTNATTEELTDRFADHYKKRGIQIPDKPEYSEKDARIIAEYEANEIIRSGPEEVAEVVDRLAALGTDKLADKKYAKERAMFHILATNRQKHERMNEFVKQGITEDVYNSDEFQKFVGMFDSKTPAEQVCKVYQKTIPKKDIKPAGSMVTVEPQDNGVKDFYTFEEANRIPREELDRNPKLYEAVCRSMKKW